MVIQNFWRSSRKPYHCTRPSAACPAKGGFIHIHDQSCFWTIADVRQVTRPLKPKVDLHLKSEGVLKVKVEPTWFHFWNHFWFQLPM